MKVIEVKALGSFTYHCKETNNLVTAGGYKSVAVTGLVMTAIRNNQLVQKEDIKPPKAKTQTAKETTNVKKENTETTAKNAKQKPSQTAN